MSTITETLTLSSLCELATARRFHAQSRKGVKRARPTGVRPRYSRWTPGKRYQLVREGARSYTEEELGAAYEANTLNEKALYVWEHTDPMVPRLDKAQPRFVATFWCAPPNSQRGKGYHVRPQQKHLRQIYAACERKDASCAQMMCADGTPYWVDRYACSRLAEREAKLTYQRNNKHKRRRVEKTP